MPQKDGASSNAASQNDGVSSSNQDLSASQADNAKRPDGGNDTMANNNSAPTAFQSDV